MNLSLPDLSRATLDEIIFEGRNQAYGAFELRRTYDQHMKRAVTVTVLLCLLLIGAPLAWQALQPEVMANKPQVPAKDKEIVLHDQPKVMPPAKPKADITPPAPKTPPVNTQEFTTRQIVADDKPVQQVDVASQDLLAGIEVGATTQTGGIDGPPAPTTSTSGTGTTTEETPVETIFSYTEVMPEYETGTAEMMKFLSKNIHFNALALRNGIEGKIFLKFVVNERGEVENPQVVKGLGAGLDEEAVRVVKLLHFRPGKQNGRPVKVFFSLPISFQIR